MSFEATSQRCVAKTRNGHRCTNPAVVGPDRAFCRTHHKNTGTILLGGPGDGIRVYNATPGERFFVKWHGDMYVYDWLEGELVFANLREPSESALEDIERGLAEVLR